MKHRIEELYRPVFQLELSKEGFLLESFTRAIVSEVLHFTSINWARLAIEKWRGKEVSNRAIVYMEGSDNVTYKTVILGTLQSNMDVMTYRLKELRADLARAIIDSKKINTPLMLLLKSTDDARMEEDLKKMKGKLAYKIEDPKYSQKMVSWLFYDPD